MMETKVPDFVSAMAWVALGKSLPEFVYFAVEICHRWPLPSATPGFSFWLKLCETAKHQRRRSAWVGQADFGKVEPNNGNHSGNCQRLSALHGKRYAREVQFLFAVFNHERSWLFFGPLLTHEFS